MLTRKNVIDACEVLLLKTPEDDASVDFWMSLGLTPDALQRALIESGEYRLRFNRSNISDYIKYRHDPRQVAEVVSSRLKPIVPTTEDPNDVEVSPALLEALCVMCAFTPINTILVLGGQGEENLARAVTRICDDRPQTIITNHPGHDSSNINKSSGPPVRLAVASMVLLDILLDQKVVPDLVILSRSVDWDVFTSVMARGNEETLVVMDHSDSRAIPVAAVEGLASALMGEAIRFGNHSIVTNMVGPMPVSYVPEASEMLKRGPEKIALAAICKNEEQFIEAMLRSCHGIADYVVLADTGSTDRTLEIAQTVLRDMDLPYKIVPVVFEHFSQARNAAIDSIPVWIDWALMLDCDEFIVPADKSKLLALIDRDGADAWSLPRYNFVRRDLTGGLIKYPDRQARFFKVSGAQRPFYINKVHEALAGTTRRLSAPSNMRAIGKDSGGPHIHHFGAFKSDAKALERELQNVDLIG